MVLRRIDPESNVATPRPAQSSRAIDGQLASISATLRDVQDKVSRTPTDSKTSSGPAPSEASYEESYHDNDPEVIVAYGTMPPQNYRDIPQEDPPEYAPPAYDSSSNAVPKEERRKRWSTSLAFFFLALFLCILLMVTQFASRSHKHKYTVPILQPSEPSPIFDYPPILPQPPTPSRSLTRHETSQSIRGTYTLHDLIDFSTSSGSISITVQLSDADILNSRSALSPTLKLSTKSGSINLTFNSPRYSNVPLNHTIILTAVSGSCNARLVHGFSTSVSTSSGSQTLNIFPATSKNETYLMTTSKSGSQRITVHDPEGAYDAKLDNFKASINTMGSASLDLRYPRSWEGTIHASLGGSGSVNLLGSNIDVDDLGKREKRARRGTGSATELSGSGSGSINFYAS